MKRALELSLSCLLTAIGIPAAHAQCYTINFDNLAAGTVVTNQYPGVTFSGILPGGAASFDPVIYNPNGPTSSEPQCLSAQGIGGFSDEFIRIDFDRDQTEVTFTLGVRFTGGGCGANDTIAVRYYEFVSNAYVLRGTFLPIVRGDLSTDRVYVFVRVTRPSSATFRRLEIEGDLAHGCGARFELIDDLSFDLDNTPPIADIISPTALACQCNSTAVTGSAYDPDGGISSWKLERQAPGAAAWTLIATSQTEVINNQLAIWTTAATTGFYILRLTVTNQCGLTATDETVVWLDKSFDNLSLRAPVAGQIYGGSICADGTASDYCSGTFTLEHRPAGVGAYAAFNSIQPPWVTNDPLGSWSTSSGVPADGLYDVRLTASDGCGNTATSPIVTIKIDNTTPIATINSPTACQRLSGVVQITGTITDANLLGWTLEYTGGDSDDWVPLVGGAGNVNNGVLFNWNTAGLRACAYTLRLVATDAAIVNCNSTVHHQTEDLVSIELNACPSDINRDHIVNEADLGAMLADWMRVCP
ncbi:MAG: hypothetical protein U1D55_12510 [Phycisphaerae bacterium]